MMLILHYITNRLIGLEIMKVKNRLFLSLCLDLGKLLLCVDEID